MSVCTVTACEQMHSEPFEGSHLNLTGWGNILVQSIWDSINSRIDSIHLGRVSGPQNVAECTVCMCSLTANCFPVIICLWLISIKNSD